MSWRRVAAKGDVPSARCHSAMVAVGTKIFLFGGQDKIKKFDDFYEFDTTSNTWKKIETAIKPPRSLGHAMTVLNGEIYLFGGSDKVNSYSHLFKFDPAKSEWCSVEQKNFVPTPRAYHTMNAYKGKLIVFGGEGQNQQFNDLYEFDLSSSSWKRLSDSVDSDTEPPPRKRHSAAVFNDKLVVFGGFQSQGDSYRGDNYDDLYSFDFTSNSWTKHQNKGPTPCPRAGHSSDIVGSKMFTFGGSSSSRAEMNELHYLDLSDFTWLKTRGRGKIPDERYGHSTAIVGKNLFLFGGSTGQNSFSDELFSLGTASVY
eukprot:TRINITY_DN1211_c0_g1_i1.p1 TRINITY_DN1211_c0_g1~~TRINITY_DN1211_c0_g1_i1.p1  ORF type:complete len:313 (-),score=51.27 TRINITY_DN1211_c0_g1_i1:65-1003(-)